MKKYFTKKIIITIILLLGFMIQPFNAVAEPDPNFHIYLMFGQSNMEGQATPSWQDSQTNSRVMVMQDETCSGVGRYGEWRLASPPLIRCVGKLGPGDYFGKTLAENTDPEITIGLVGAAYQGQSINFFLKNCAELGTCTPTNGNGAVPEGLNGGYAWLLDLAKKAQQDGVIKGIIMHQGETDTGQWDWLDRVNAVVTDLRNDLGIGDVPFIAGEMVPGACCTAHDAIIHQIPGVISNGYYVSADGLGAMDAYHFNAEGYREIGRRYAEKMLTLVDTTPDDGGDSGDNGDNETDVVAAINAGSSQGDTYDGVYYNGDNYYNGGRTSSTTDTITGASNTSIYQTERYGSYTYEIPVDNGDYRVALGMVEMYWDQAGSRSFSVAIEGTTVLTNLDIYQQVGHDVAYDQGPYYTVVNDGSLTIQVSTAVDNGTLSRILVLAGHSDNPDSGDYAKSANAFGYTGDGKADVVAAINAGSSQGDTYNGVDYDGDNYYDSGRTSSTTDTITGASNTAIYQTERYGSYTYEIPVDNGDYSVSLGMVERYWDQAGSRSFSVAIEGEMVLKNLDIYQQVGHDVAYDRGPFNTVVSDGSLTIQVSTAVDNGTLSRILVLAGHSDNPDPGDDTDDGDDTDTGTSTDEDTGYDCQIISPSGSNGGSSNVLPDPFTMWDGTQVETMEDWRCRRRELVVEVEKRILGEKAPPPASIGGSVTGSISTSSYTVNVQNPGGSTSFSGTVSLPGTGSAPYPAVIVIGGFNSLSSDVLSSEGVATMSYDAYAIASESSGNFTTGKYYDANPDQRGNTGALVAWAWGVSRIIDMLEKNPGVIDATKIAIHGCSRFGKAAFVIGAFDQRIALGLPTEPGTGGPAPLRALPSLGGQTLSSCIGEASWFGPMASNYSSSMAVDMSDVAAMYAPRGLLLMDNPHIDHLSYKANYLGCAAAYEVYDAMGESDALWYLGNTNNGNHCSVRSEYAGPLRAMIRKFLKGDGSATTGGLDTHANHGYIDVSGWTRTWNKGTISQ